MMIGLIVGMAFLLVAWRVFSSKPEHMESEEEKLERDHESGLIDDDEYIHKRAALPH